MKTKPAAALEFGEFVQMVRKEGAAEWTAETVGELVGETFNGAWAIANAHNAALAAERKETEQVTDYGVKLQQQLAAEREQRDDDMYAIAEKYQKELAAEREKIDSLEKAYSDVSHAAAQAFLEKLDHYIKIDVRRAVLCQHIKDYFGRKGRTALDAAIAEATKPLVEALEQVDRLAYNHVAGAIGKAQKIVRAALAAVKK